MDIKPSNIILGKDNELILIDVGGAGGTTREWLSPAMKEVQAPLMESFQARKENDIWAVGEVLSRMSEAVEREPERLLLQSAASAAKSDPAHVSLTCIASDLSCPPSELK